MFQNYRFIIALIIAGLMDYLVTDINEIKSVIVYSIFLIAASLIHFSIYADGRLKKLENRISELEEKIEDQESCIEVHEEQILALEKIIFPNEDDY